MTMYLVIAVVVLFFLVIFQISKASEYVSILKGEKEASKQNNKINGFLMIVFLILGLIGVWYCNKILYPQTLLNQPSGSVEGEKVDEMLWITIIITGVVFIITQVLLFYFAFRYQHNDNRKPFYFKHSSKLEAIWTTLPAIALTVLVVIGLINWNLFTNDPPKNAMEVEVIGKQFGWIFRYPGKDKTFGKKYYKNIDPASNTLGLIFEDEFAHDDIVNEQILYLVKNKPIKLIIGSRDVVHDVGLPHFRLKMDAVPGIPTTLWFTPQYTTEEMKTITGNPNFQYELSCDQMCGNGHYSMKGVIIVVDQLDYDLWMAKQKPLYLTNFPEKDKSIQPIQDTTKKLQTITKL